MSYEFVQLPNQIETTLISRVISTRLNLIQGLHALEHSLGWADPTDEDAQSLWTAIEVLTSLLASKYFSENIDKVLTEIENEKINQGKLVGWNYEGFSNLISTYVTGDVIRLYLSLAQIYILPQIIESFQELQNQDGGWGVLLGDKVSKVRPTGWALSVLFECIKIPKLREYVNFQKLNSGIQWLYSAQNNSTHDKGWGNLFNTWPSDVTATALALDALLESVKCAKENSDYSVQIKLEAIQEGLSHLRSMGKSEWFGRREEVPIFIDQEMKGRHVMGGAGITCALQVLIKAHMLGLIEWPDEVTIQAVNIIIERCKTYDHVGGYWLVPSDDGGVPLSWNSAYGINALLSFERFYYEHIAPRWIERDVYQSITKPVRFWQRFASILLIVLIGVIVTPYFGSLNIFISWFASISTLAQGIILIFVTIVIERVYDFLSTMIGKRLRLKNLLSKT